MLLEKMYIMVRSKKYKVPDIKNLATNASLKGKVNQVKDYY